MVPRLAEPGIGVGAQQHGIGTVDADETQLAQRLGNGIRVVPHVGRQGRRRIAGALTHAFDAGGSVALEDGPIFCKGEPSRSILRGLPVRVVRAALHVVDLLAIEIERGAQFDQRFHLTLSRKDIFSWCLDVTQVAGADGRERNAAWSLHVHNAPAGEVALEGARRLLLDLRPRGIGDRSELAMKVIHETGLL